MIKLAVIADDITGANDTAVQFAKRNINSYVRIDFDEEKLFKETADVIVIDTDSRDISSVEAYEKVKQVCEVLHKSGVKNVYKKIDSTLRGNLGVEIEATAAVFRPELVVIAPAFPSNNRVTIGGYHLLHHIPIELTEIARAPKSSVNESRVVELLQKQTTARIGLITLNTVIAGTLAIKQAINDCLERGERWIVFDAALDEHLAAIIDAAKDYNNVLWVGSAGLAEQLASIHKWSEKKENKVTVGDGAVLMIAGSVSKITQTQISTVLALPNIVLVKMNVAELIHNSKAEIMRCAEAAKMLIAQGKDVLIASAVNDDDVDTAVKAGREYGLSSAQVSEETAAALAKVAAQLTNCRLAGMVLTGGDTAIHVCRSLGAEAIQVLEEIACGIPLGKIVGGCCSGLPVVTKAGAFGNDDAFVRSMQAMRRYE